MHKLILNDLCISTSLQKLDVYIETQNHIYKQLQDELDQVLILINLLDINNYTLIVDLRPKKIAFIYINNRIIIHLHMTNHILTKTILKDNDKQIYTNKRNEDPYHTFLRSLIYIKNIL